MKTLLSRLFGRFTRDERGSYSMELMILFPMLVFGYMGMFVFFDAFRQQNANLKASYTLSDILSRQTNPVDQSWMTGLNQMLDYLTASNHPTYLRTTTVYWDENRQQHVKIWSEGSFGVAGLSQDEVDRELTPKIPMMAHADTAIVVETFMMYEPLINVGIGPTEFHNVVVTSPRFSGHLCWNECGAEGSWVVHDDGTDDGATTVGDADGGSSIDDNPDVVDDDIT